MKRQPKTITKSQLKQMIKEAVLKEQEQELFDDEYETSDFAPDPVEIAQEASKLIFQMLRKHQVHESDASDVAYMLKDIIVDQLRQAERRDYKQK